MPMDALRMSQIREALDDDKKYYGQSFDIVKRYGGLTQEAPTEYAQLNQEDIKSLDELVPAFIGLLEQKTVDVQNVIRTNSATAPGAPGTYTNNIGQVEDVINAYNKIISVILNPANTPQTKEALMTSLMKSEANIKHLEVLCEHVGSPSAHRNRGYDQTVLHVVSESL